MLPPTEDPLVVTDPLTSAPAVDEVEPPATSADVLAENDEPEGIVEVGTLRGSIPVLVVVWACAVVIAPRQMIAVRIVVRIAFSCTGSDRRTAPSPC